MSEISVTGGEAACLELNWENSVLNVGLIWGIQHFKCIFPSLWHSCRTILAGRAPGGLGHLNSDPSQWVQLLLQILWRLWVGFSKESEGVEHLSPSGFSRVLRFQFLQSFPLMLQGGESTLGVTQGEWAQERCWCVLPRHFWGIFSQVFHICAVISWCVPE